MKELVSPMEIMYCLSTPDGKTNIPDEGDTVLAKSYLCDEEPALNPVDFFLGNPIEETVGFFIKFDNMHHDE